MINLTGVDLMRIILKNTLVTDTSDFLASQTEFPEAIADYLKHGDITKLADISMELDCYTGHPEITLHDEQIPQYLSVKY